MASCTNHISPAITAAIFPVRENDLLPNELRRLSATFYCYAPCCPKFNAGLTMLTSHDIRQRTANAISPPNQISLRANDGARREQQRNENTNGEEHGECLFSIPSPTSPPNQSQSVGEPPLIIPTSRYINANHSRGSNAFIEKKLPTARLNSAQSDAAQASATAHLRPPSSRARTPVSATVAAPAKAGSKRMANNDWPRRTSLNRSAKSTTAADRFAKIRQKAQAMYRVHRESNRIAVRQQVNVSAKKVNLMTLRRCDGGCYWS